MLKNQTQGGLHVLEKSEVDQLREEYDSLLRQVAFINEFTSMLLSIGDIEEMLDKVASGLHKMMGIDRIGIFCLNESERTYECRYAAGIDSSIFLKRKIPLSIVEDILTEAAVSKRPFFPHDQLKGMTQRIYESWQEEEKETLAFPIYLYRGEGCLQNRMGSTMQIMREFSNERESKHRKNGFTVGKDCMMCRFFPVYGILWLDNWHSGKSFNHELITIYTLLLSMNVAMENKYLMRELQDISLKDSLTGAYNRLYLSSTLKKEIERTVRLNSKLSVSIIDLDNFKNINDLYGHQFGDRFLAQFSQLAQGSIRKMDYFCRYGGDEFVFVLPEASAAQAKLVMHRIIKKIKEQGIRVDGRSLEIKLSGGIASFPSHAKNAKQLIEVADKALYEAKKLGKGIIKVFRSSRH